ncbi:MAG: transposase [Thermodesulfobacteriota bacterium]|nr:transposase [Thermodesulfobacteriota bacterium]
MTHGKDKKNFSICTAEEFIAAITQHIPNPSFQMVRYVGWYSNRMRGDRKKQKLEEKKTETPDEEEIEIIDVSKHQPRKIPPPTWRECTPRALASRAHKKSMGGRSIKMPALSGRDEDYQFHQRSGRYSEISEL